jgi:anti-sigma regulatory factor (Ser/Thr protein kinase)
MDAIQSEKQIARLQIPAKTEFLPLVLDFARRIGEKFDLESAELSHLEIILEEACLNVIEHAFDSHEDGCFDVLFLRRPGQLVLAVEDQGLPFDFRRFESGPGSGFGMLLMRAFADEIHFINLGRQGKRIELIKNVYQAALEAPPSTSAEATEAPEESAEFTIRLMTAEDLVGMARCIYRSYGYSYSHEFVYYPEKVIEMLRNGRLKSAVTLNRNGEVIGHLAMTMTSQEAPVGESGIAVVDPLYRGHDLFKKMKLFLVDEARRTGMQGIYSEAVTSHPYSQKGNISLGARETGILLGFSPPTMFFKKIQAEQKKERGSAVLYYLKLKDESHPPVYPPLHHQGIVKKIYEHGGFRREIRNETNELPALPPTSRVDVEVAFDESRAFLNVAGYGRDIVDLVKFRFKELCTQKIEIIFIDLPLSHPATATICPALEMLGFFFCGIIPHKQQGDVLRLQYLNNVQIDPDAVVIVSDFGKELFGYIRSALS